MAQPVLHQTREEPELDRSIGLGRVLFQSVATMAPGASIVFGLGLIISYSGPATPFAMLLAVAASLLIAVCVGELARHIPSAGGMYSYAATALGDNIGFLVGWVYGILYITLICVTSITFSLVLDEFLNLYVSIDLPEWILSVIVVGFTMTVTYLGVRPSTSLTTALAIAEVALLLLVSVLLIVRGGSENSVSLFNPANAVGTEEGAIRAIFLGVIFAMGALAAFESSINLAEEANTPRRVIPRAVLLSTAAIGLFYVVASYAAVVGWGTGNLETFIDSPNPWREMADKVGGFFAFLVVLAILNSQVASIQGSFNSASRLLFAMSRNKMLPRAISRIHATRRSPHIAAFVTGATALAAIFYAKAQFGGAFNAFVFFLTTATIIFIVLYASMSIATSIFYLKERRSEFRAVVHLVVPSLSLAILAPAMYFSVKGLTYPANIAAPVVVGWTVVGAALLAVLRRRGVDISAEGQRWLQPELGEAPEDPSVD